MSMKELAKKIVFRYTSMGVPKYPYNIEPIQLAEIVKGIDFTLKNNSIKGSLVEIGVARGLTSRFIVEHCLNNGYSNDFYCLDTFSSFTENDIVYEVDKRGKSRSELVGFAYNSFEIWKRNFSKYNFVKPIKCDASSFDFSKISPISFCFLDVDLYLPTKNVLKNIFPYLNTSAIVIVDDVMDNNCWDGAYQAFMEFTEENDLSYEIVGNKCGVIRVHKGATNLLSATED